MAKPDDLDRLPLPKSWPKLARRALVLVNSMLKVSLDIELGRRLDCAVRRKPTLWLQPRGRESISIASQTALMNHAGEACQERRMRDT